MNNPGRRWPHRSVAEVLKTGRLPNNFVGALSARFELTSPDGKTLSTDLQKKGGLHAFLRHVAAGAAPVPGLAYFTLLGVNRDGGAHILHSLFSILVRTYDLNQRLFGCRGELPPEGLPAITKISVDSFGAQRALSVVSQDDHHVHLEGAPPSVSQTTPCERESGKGEGQSLSCWGLAFLPPDADAPLFHLEGSVSEFSKIIFTLLAYQEPPYKEALDWIQFSFTGDPKG